MEKREFAATILITLLVAVPISLAIGFYFRQTHITYLSTLGVDMESTSIHTQITMFQNGKKVFDEYHAGAVTNLGDNMTLFWIFGDTDMRYGDIPYRDNGTYISIGDQGALTTASVVLPGEWNRTLGTIDNEGQSFLNLSCIFYPDNGGPYTADCIGINLNATASANNLIMYDTFSEVTGIDETFTINVDIQITVAHT